MSADLLAEFGQGNAPAQSSLGTQSTKQSQTQSNQLGSDFDQSDDIFFGTSSKFQSATTPPLGSKPVSGQYMTQATTGQQSRPDVPAFNIPRQNNSDILFDATEDLPASDAEDDWGDFEGPEASATQPNHSAYSISAAQEANPSIPPTTAPQIDQSASNLDLLESLSIEDTTSSTKKSHGGVENKPSQQNVTSPTSNPTWDDDSFGDWGEFTEAPSKTSKSPTHKSTFKASPDSVPKPMARSPAKKKSITPKPTPPAPAWDDDAFDDWGDFNDGPAPAPAAISTPKKSSHTSPPPTDSFTSGSTTQSSTVRPTNIPPPSVLLELLVDLMNNLQKEAASTSKTRQESTDQSKTAAKIHTTLSTAARIIAGRTLRWKRDTILSQSMRIGPARAGKSSGMKLSAVNKHEDVKEEQDAVDVLALWRERAALFNNVVQAAGLRPIPTVASPAALKVVTAKSGQGALKATHACALCALQRDERLLRVDEDNVQDSFGEWWTEHWGHTGCRLFWEANHSLLGQR
ncbi:hypothetical protein PENSTE_c014G05805 [Penicillium steckii]|uniref:Uncharacterized protein n=1 Tax=Penicillium steckii TaxID=303698 RepID=A0A1V6T1Z1_9EURO|nr:hypothetical protein PENSTE_c014G05805 [Penicillium steckii]